MQQSDAITAAVIPPTDVRVVFLTAQALSSNTVDGLAFTACLHNVKKYSLLECPPADIFAGQQLVIYCASFEGHCSTSTSINMCYGRQDEILVFEAL